jgi:hypothetical protein
MRPNSIIWFEALNIAAMAVATLNMVTGWDKLVAIFSATGAAFVFAGSLALTVLLTLLVSRKASRVAKWVVVGLYASGLVGMLPAFMGWTEPVDLTWNEWVVWLVQGVATSLLFTPSARGWMRRSNDPAADPDTLERTFE